MTAKPTRAPTRVPTRANKNHTEPSHVAHKTQPMQPVQLTLGSNNTLDEKRQDRTTRFCGQTHALQAKQHTKLFSGINFYSLQVIL